MTLPHIIVWYVVKHMKRLGFKARNVCCGHTRHVRTCHIQSTTSAIIAMPEVEEITIMDWAYKTHQLLYKGLLLIFQTMFNYTLGQETVRGHPFMTSTKNHVFDPLPLSTCVHMGRTHPPPCGRPHTVDMKYTPLS